MNNTVIRCLDSQIVDEDVQLTLVELCQACQTPQDLITAWVFEGVLEPTGQQPQEWRFSGPALHRARLAHTLMQDLEINEPGVALALDLLDQIDLLKAQLARLGRH
jgi:chaperone modulatory protein CbpM